MNDAVTEAEETTSADSSQESELKTTEEDSSESDSSSSEDVNAQSEEGEDETVQEARDEVKSPQGVNRVQKLANEKKQLAEENQSLRQQVQEMQESQVQNMRPPQTNEEYLAQQIAVQNYSLNQTRQELSWNDAKRDFPELDEDSDQYDVDFDNMVYAEHAAQALHNPNVTPKQVAAKVRAYLDRVAGKAASKAEGVREIKRSVSTTGTARTESESGPTDAYQQAKVKWKRSGSIDDLADVVSHL